MKKKINSCRIFFPALLVFGFLLFSCSKPGQSDRDHLVFRYNEAAGIPTLDPAFSRNLQTIWAANQLYNGLVQLDDSLNIVPDIAHSWEIDDTTHTYTFYLRSDVFFHKNKVFAKEYPDSTRTVTASDFVYSFDRLTDQSLASPGSWVMNFVSGYQAENDTTFQIRLKKSFPAFLGLLSTRYCSVVPEEAVDFYGSEFRRNPVGTGPFQFKMWEENVKLVFRKNPVYFEKDENGKPLPYLEAVAITFLPDKQSEFLSFVQGKLDFISGLDNSYKDDILTSSGELQHHYDDRIQMITGPYLNTEYLGFYLDSESGPVSSKKFRQAVNYGFDREKMITYLRNGIGFPAHSGFIPQGLPGFGQAAGYHYNPEKAKELLSQYSSETGDLNPKIQIATTAQYLDLIEYIQRELERIGIEVKIDVMPPSTLLQMRSSGNLEVFRASWIADYPDAESYLSLFYSPNFSPNGPNYTHFKDENFDFLFEKSLKITAIEERQVLYGQMDSVIMAQAPVVPLYYDMAVRFAQKNISGLGINPQNFLVLKRVKKLKNGE